MKQEKDYFAFISYQRKDEEWADRLRSKLEHYRLPSNVRKQDASLPKEIRPIFRDALELAGGVLAKEIETALQNSKFLIVICSPNSAKSPWVNKEIQTFIDLGREDRIIPFIIDGTSFSDNEETECFPPALRSLKGEKELLGININELSRDAAVIKVVARMFNLRFDSLWQRYEREQRSKRWMIIAGALFFAFISSGIGGYIAHQNRELDARNKEIVEERDRANAERDRAESANASLLLANDSIKRQYTLIEQQKNEIATERDNVKKANYSMQINLSRILAEKASTLVDEGDSYLARLLALEALPPHRPYTVEAEIALRKAASHQTTILYGHQEPVNNVTYSKDGRLLASFSQENVAMMWDAITGKLLWEFEYERGVFAPYNSVAFSPDGEYVAIPFRRGIFLLDSQTGQLRRMLHTSDQNSMISSVAFSQNGRTLIAGSQDYKVRIWNVRNSNEVLRFEGHKNRIVSVAISPNGELAASASYDHTVIIWNVKKKQEIQTLKGHSVAFSPDGNMLAISSENNIIKTFDIYSGKELQTYNGHKGIVYSAKFSPDGKKIVSASEDKTIKIWDVMTGKELQSYVNSSPIRYAEFSPDGKHIVSGLYDKTIRVWDVGATHLNNINLATDINYNDAHFTSDGKSVIIGGWGTLEDTVHVVDLSSGNKQFMPKKLVTYKQKTANQNVLPVDSSEVEYSNMYVFSNDGNYFAYFNTSKSMGEIDLLYKGIRLWSVSLPTKQGYFFSMAISPDNQYLLVAPDDETLRIWRVKTGEEIVHFDLPEVAHNIIYSPDGGYFAFTIEQTIRVWDAKTFRELFVFNDENSDIIGLDFCPDAKRIVSVSSEGTVRIWDFPHLQELIDETRERFKNRPLTPEERRKYYIE